MAAGLCWCWEWVILICLLVNRRPWVEGSVSSLSDWSGQSYIPCIYAEQFFVRLKQVSWMNFSVVKKHSTKCGSSAVLQKLPLHQAGCKSVKGQRACRCNTESVPVCQVNSGERTLMREFNRWQNALEWDREKDNGSKLGSHSSVGLAGQGCMPRKYAHAFDRVRVSAPTHPCWQSCRRRQSSQ